MWELLSTLLHYCYHYYYFVACMFLVPDWQLPLEPLTSDPKKETKKEAKSQKEAEISSIIPKDCFLSLWETF